MDTRPSKADQHMNPTMNRRTVGIVFFPVVGFVVRCKLVQRRPLDKYREAGKSSIKGGCYLTTEATSRTLKRGSVKAAYN
jgi:hypothetical protein